MPRISMAFRCFFRLLFRGNLPPAAADYLPESVPPALLEPGLEPDKAKEAKEAKGKPEKGKEAKEPAREVPGAREEARRPERRPADVAEHHREGALALLALLQREGRFIDFLRESLSDYDDADIGASVRDIHRGCRKVIDEHLDIEPVMPGEEDDRITVQNGFDPGEVRLVGDVNGEPPFQGVLRHHGWRVTQARLPALSDGVDRHVLAPAEVEIA